VDPTRLTWVALLIRFGKHLSDARQCAAMSLAQAGT